MSTVSPPTHSILEYFHPAPSVGHRCGYCKSPDTNRQHGMWAHRISPENYEYLVNLGWSRSGSYIYKPMNEKICCPAYTIRHLPQKVQISKSQRKVLKRFRKYLSDGEVPNNGEAPSNGEIPCNPEIPISNGLPAVKYSRGLRRKEVDGIILCDNGKEPPVPASLICPRTTTGKPPTKIAHHPLKKKPLRRERKRQKLLAKGLDPEEFFRRNDRDRIKELGNFFRQGDGEDKLEFSTKLLRVDSPGFEKHLGMEHKLYRKYMMKIHGDKEDDCKESDYKRFYCANPFSVGGDVDDDDDIDAESGGSGGGDEPSTKKANEKPPVLLGTYHQHYYISSTLIAVGVMDVLPHSIYSASFFYDPDYSFLNPGTLGALHEIHFMNELAKSNPKMEYYHLGFYIHSCVKMKYKAKFKPCQLLCPATGEWVGFDARVAGLIDSVNGGYVKLDGDRSGALIVDNYDETKEKIFILQNGIHKFKDFVEISPRSDDKKRALHEMLESFVNLVGPTVASNMLMYVPSSANENSSSSDESSEHE